MSNKKDYVIDTNIIHYAFLNKKNSPSINYQKIDKIIKDNNIYIPSIAMLEFLSHYPNRDKTIGLFNDLNRKKIKIIDVTGTIYLFPDFSEKLDTFETFKNKHREKRINIEAQYLAYFTICLVWPLFKFFFEKRDGFEKAVLMNETFSKNIYYKLLCEYEKFLVNNYNQGIEKKIKKYFNTQCRDLFNDYVDIYYAINGLDKKEIENEPSIKKVNKAYNENNENNENNSIFSVLKLEENEIQCYIEDISAALKGRGDISEEQIEFVKIKILKPFLSHGGKKFVKNDICDMLIFRFLEHGKRLLVGDKNIIELLEKMPNCPLCEDSADVSNSIFNKQQT